MSDINNNAKINLIWRGVLTLLGVVTVTGVTKVLGKQDRALEKLDSTASDVAQIKWELPVIKENARNDKDQILKMIQNLEDQLQTLRSYGNEDRKEISDLKTIIALLKQKLQLP